MNDKDSKLIWENFNEGRGDDPWGETDGERHTREVEFPSEKSLEHLQELLPKLNEDQSKYLQSALYDVVGAINDMIENSQYQDRKKELTDFAYDGDGDDWVAGLFDKDGDEIDDDNEDPRDRLNWS